MKKYLFVLIIVAAGFFGQGVFAQSPTPVTPSLNSSLATPCTNPDGTECYKLLEALPGGDGTDIESIDLGQTGSEGGIAGFINFAMEIGIGVAGVLGVVMLVIYGFQYAANDKNVGNFELLKGKITSVVLGLMLLLGITIILKTINPDLLIVEPDIAKVTFETGGDTPYSGTPQQLGSGFTAFKQFASSHNIYCPESGGRQAIPQIARSMEGKITYSMDNRFSQGPNNTWYLDCSGFVHTVYSCAGLPSPGTYTGAIFSQKQSVSGATVKIGDLIGWVSGENKEKWGHVIMFIGNGETIESRGGSIGRTPGKALVVQKITPGYGNRLKYVKPL